MVVLAGGKSRRIGSDKAFLGFKGRPFVRVVTDEMLKISEEVLVVIGRKDRREFERVLDSRAKVVNDNFDVDNPVNGIVSGCQHASRPYAAFLACDTPMAKSEAVSFLHALALDHSAAVPIWETGELEPLCAVYRTSDIMRIGFDVMMQENPSCKALISRLSDVNYVEIRRLKVVDPEYLGLGPKIHAPAGI